MWNRHTFDCGNIANKKTKTNLAYRKLKSAINQNMAVSNQIFSKTVMNCSVNACHK